MGKSYVSMKYEELKEKFNNFLIHKKKVKALENYAEVQEFEGAKYIRLLKELLIDGFLDEQEEKFLEHQIKKAEIDAFTWSHKTKWLKKEMDRLSATRFVKPSAQLYMDFDKEKTIATGNYPVELIAQVQASQQGARV